MQKPSTITTGPANSCRCTRRHRAALPRAVLSLNPCAPQVSGSAFDGPDWTSDMEASRESSHSPSSRRGPNVGGSACAISNGARNVFFIESCSGFSSARLERRSSRPGELVRQFRSHDLGGAGA